VGPERRVLGVLWVLTVLAGVTDQRDPPGRLDQQDLWGQQGAQVLRVVLGLLERSALTEPQGFQVRVAPQELRVLQEIPAQ